MLLLMMVATLVMLNPFSDVDLSLLSEYSRRPYISKIYQNPTLMAKMMVVQPMPSLPSCSPTLLSSRCVSAHDHPALL